MSIYIYIYIYMCMYICVCIYIYIYRYIHMYMFAPQWFYICYMKHMLFWIWFVLCSHVWGVACNCLLSCSCWFIYIYIYMCCCILFVCRGGRGNCLLILSPVSGCCLSRSLSLSIYISNYIYIYIYISSWQTMLASQPATQLRQARGRLHV